jgi:hypothetical protein
MPWIDRLIWIEMVKGAAAHRATPLCRGPSRIRSDVDRAMLPDAVMLKVLRGTIRRRRSMKKGRGVSTMMDLSSIIDAGLTFAGVIAVVFMGVATLSGESTTAFASQHRDEDSANHEYRPVWKKAA